MKLIAGAALAALLVVHAAPSQQAPPVAPAAAPATTVPSPPPPFNEWLAALRIEAAGRGIRGEILDQAFADLQQPEAQIIERDRSQAEFTLNLETYLKRRLTRETARTAQQKYSTYRELLERVSKKYGVNPRILIAVWGLESNFGRFSGVRPTIQALVTLAYDSRRGTMFRTELLNALEILNRGDIDVTHLKGSWAGALGQPQFMPSSYLEYAQDFDGDGRRDIWTSEPDVFASVAYYLQRHGWAAGDLWGREVKMPEAAREKALAIPRRETGCLAERIMTDPLPLRAWRTLGLRTMANTALPATETPASLVQAGSRSFLLYANYGALLNYNCAHTYALSVGLLADRLR